MPIQRVDFDTYYLVVHCPFCGQRVTLSDEEFLAGPDYCEHVLYGSNQEGYHYVSDRFEAHAREVGIPFDGDELDDEDDDDDDPLDRITLKDAVEFATYTQPPFVQVEYIGFAPLPKEP